MHTCLLGATCIIHLFYSILQLPSLPNCTIKFQLNQELQLHYPNDNTNTRPSQNLKIDKTYGKFEKSKNKNLIQFVGYPSFI